LVWRLHRNWLEIELPQYLNSATVRADDLAEAEEWLARDASLSSLVPATAKAHVHRAAQIAPRGRAAAVALFHLERAIALGVEKTDEELRKARAVADATLSTTPEPKYRLDISLEPTVEPEVRELIFSALLFQLGPNDDAMASLDPLSADSDLPRVAVWVTSATLVSDASEVSTVRSRYFSHFQETPNPAKTDLELRCNAAEFNVAMARNSYNSAVSSHNIWPTEYSLNNVNMAYNRYSMAVAAYNILANSYNATPSTITESVYMPYAFQQGYVSYGWKLGVRLQVNAESPINIQRESVVRDYVRIGSSGMDEVPAYRNQDPIDIDVSAKSGLDHLYRTIDHIRDDISPMLARLGGEPIAALSLDETRLLGWIYHPWGMNPALTMRLELAEWVCETARGFRLARIRPSPNEQQLTDCSDVIAGPLNPESASEQLGPLVCRTISSKEGAGLSHGSGVLIGPNGLVLTCAHVLSGPMLEIEFSNGPYMGRRPGSVVFVNRARDVALLRVDSLANERWASVRLDAPPRPGEPIVAIGNPELEIGGTNIGGISAGIVSNPSVELFNSSYLAADITVSSGSSGGPLFSLSDGAVIGVIQAVGTSPGLKSETKEVSSSGYTCLAASGDRLREWLGLRSGQ
jgi:hypothetical protein